MFDNATIAERTYGKPHIVLLSGWWRVSAMKNYRQHQRVNYMRAHEYANNLNHKLRFPGLAPFVPGSKENPL